MLVECAQLSNIAVEVGAYLENALHNLDIDAVSVPTDFYEYLNRVNFFGDFDIVFLETTFENFDVGWLAYEFWSEYADEPYQNFAKFTNATYDSLRDQLLYATSYEDVYEVAIEMQKILVYECPIIVCYSNQLLSAYRTDRYECFVNDVSDGTPGWWTNYKVHLKDYIGDQLGGTFRWSISEDIDTFNFMTSRTMDTSKVNSMMWDSLIKIDDDGDDINWLAESYITETHADNLAVPDGYTQFTFNIIQNATWTDGKQMTAEDVAFTLNYYRDSPGNPYGSDLSDMTAAYTPTPYKLVVQFSKESFWYLHTVSYKPVLPTHVFTMIGIDGWNLWDPDPLTTPIVTSGPFNISGYVDGEFCELTVNPFYFYGSGSRNIHPPPLPPPPPGPIDDTPSLADPLFMAIVAVLGFSFLILKLKSK